MTASKIRGEPGDDVLPCSCCLCSCHSNQSGSVIGVLSLPCPAPWGARALLCDCGRLMGWPGTNAHAWLCVCVCQSPLRWRVTLSHTVCVRWGHDVQEKLSFISRDLSVNILAFWDLTVPFWQLNTIRYNVQHYLSIWNAYRSAMNTYSSSS